MSWQPRGAEKGPLSVSVVGLSTLREAERSKQKPQELSEEQKRLQAFLAQKYGAGAGDAAAEQPKKKKKKKKESAAAGGMRIVDQDVSGFRAAPARAARPHSAAGRGAAFDEEEDEEDQPVVANAEEAERLKQIVAKERQFYGARNDGSGWQVLGSKAEAQVDDASPPRRQRHDSPDASPPRRRGPAAAAAADVSPPRRQRHDSPDASPPRRQAGAAADASPPRRQRHDSPDVSSPPRRQRHANPDVSPPRRRGAHADASPPRRQRHDSPDASPPRRGRHDSPDASPPRRGRHDSPDASPPRRLAAAASADASPPRRRPGENDDEEGGRGAKRVKMSDGTIAGMVSGRELMSEMQRKREAERSRFESLGAEVTGRGAQTVFRDREGRAVSRDEFLEARAAERKKGKAQYDDERSLAWGGGLKQRAEAEERVRAMEEEAAKPFARYRNDAELDAIQRNAVRWGDPMAHLVKRNAPELEAPPSLVAARAEQLRKSGFVIPLEVPPHSWLRRGVGPPINRYNIRPGRHWDGVDRSNGFEADMFKRINELKWREQQAFMMAQDDD